MRQLITNIVHALQTQPLALALVLVNVIYVVAGGLFLREVASAMERRDAVLLAAGRDCPKP